MFLESVSQTLSQPAPNSTPVTLEVVRLNCVYTKDGANAQWSKWTPSGSLTLSISNPDAMGTLKPGFYKITITPCGAED